MPQTTNAVPISCGRIDIATDALCAVWTNVSGSANSVAGTEQSKMHASEHTLDGVGPLVEIGKYEELQLTFRIVFTNVVTEAYRIVREEWLSGACDGKICVRWIPSGVVGGDGMQTNYAPIKTFQWPEINAGEAGPIMVSFSIIVSEIDPFVFVS